MTHAALFNGIGGFQLAAEWMEWENVMSCEIDEWCNQVTKYYWPNCIQYGNIYETDFTIHRGTIDILTGGFPCQPFSIAGQRKGKDDERFLFPEVIRAITEIQPRKCVILENVAGLISILEPASFTNVEREAVQFYNKEHLLFKVEHKKRTKIEVQLQAIQDRVISEVIKQIENTGYLLPRTAKGEPIVLCIPACAVNAPHRRDRIWFVAFNSNCWAGSGYRQEQKVPEPYQSTYSTGVCQAGTATDTTGQQSEWMQSEQREISEQEQGEFRGSNSENATANTNSGRQSCKEYREAKSRWVTKTSIPDDWQNFPTQSPVCNGDDGLSSRLDGITFSKWRQNSIKAGGNAIVPQVALEIFKAIEAYNNHTITQ